MLEYEKLAIHERMFGEFFPMLDGNQSFLPAWQVLGNIRINERVYVRSVLYDAKEHSRKEALRMFLVQEDIPVKPLINISIQEQERRIDKYLKEHPNA
jgi:hypothetical protein